MMLVLSLARFRLLDSRIGAACSFSTCICSTSAQEWREHLVEFLVNSNYSLLYILCFSSNYASFPRIPKLNTPLLSSMSTICWPYWCASKSGKCIATTESGFLPHTMNYALRSIETLYSISIYIFYRNLHTVYRT